MHESQSRFGKQLAPSLLLVLTACQQAATPPVEIPPKNAAFSEVALALSVAGTEIVTVGGANSGARVAVTALNAGMTLLALDWRPSDGLVYTLGSDGQLYTLAQNGTLTATVTPQDYGNLSEGVAFDVNPQLDALRVIATADGRNFVTDPDMGVPTEYTASAYEGGTPATPKVLATAYSNPVSPFPENAVTTQYSLEAVGNTYSVQAKNDGTLTPVATLELDLAGFAGLDVSAATGNAYALLNVGGATNGGTTVGGKQTLYRIGASAGGLTELEVDMSGLADLTILPQ